MSPRGVYALTSGSETLSAAANIFMGQTEAPLLIKPYVPRMTRSELQCMMTGGMATIAGGVLGPMAGWLLDPDTEGRVVLITDATGDRSTFTGVISGNPGTITVSNSRPLAR